MKSLSLVFILTTLICFNVIGQVVQADNYSLNLSDSERKIENTINMNVSKSEYESIQSITGEKMDIRTNGLTINGDTIKPEKINTRGQTTLHFKRKSFGFKLNSGATFRHGEKTEKLKKFDVISLSMDKYYIRNRLSFGMMEGMGLFKLFYTFCDLRINSKSEGINMVIERPEDWAEHKKKSPLMLRRGYDHKIEKIETDKKIEKSEKNKYLDYYKEIYKSLNKFEGEELYNTLSNWIDLNNYMKWLVFNFMVRNGDYSDEVFFYIDPEINKFRIIPWDYDDTFAIAPHEGKDKSKKVVGDKLIFSSEDLLDVKIATDPYLYNTYLKVFKEVLDKITPDYLKVIFEETYSELYPYYSKQEIISNSQYDYFKDANLEYLRTEMLNLYLGLRSSRDRYLENPGNR